MVGEKYLEVLQKGEGIADEKHLEVLWKGIGAWNEWRRKTWWIEPDLRKAYLHGFYFHNMNFQRANLGKTVLAEADLSNADLSNATLRKANLRGANLCKANLRQANLFRADLSKANLQQAALHDANLDGGTLYEANLCGAHLRGVNLCEANLCKADLRGADLSRANLSKANFYRADLRGANLCMADLSRTDFTEANLRGATFQEACLNRTILGGTDLTGVRGLSSCFHFAPSFIDSQTLMESGRLPLAFLQGCGLPDPLIELLPSLFSESYHCSSCFLHYSEQDEDFAKRLHRDLQASGVRCWLAPHGFQSSKKLHQPLDEAVREYDKVLLILSQHSMDSDWVSSEMLQGYKREKQKKRRILFPLQLVDSATIKRWRCFDIDTKRDLATETRESHLLDFSNWNDPAIYGLVFADFLSALRRSTQRNPDVCALPVSLPVSGVFNSRLSDAA